MSYRSCRLCCLMIICTLCLLSCGRHSFEAAGAFERAFETTVKVNNGETEYLAAVSLALFESADTLQGSERSVRDGSIRFLSPESVSDITAQRKDGTVTIGVSGVEITPSSDIASKYVQLLELLDLRAAELQSYTDLQGSTPKMIRAVYESGEKNVTVTFDKESLLPVTLSDGTLNITFTEFVYI